MPKLQAYFDRIGYRGVVRPDVQALFDIHRSQAFSIPYEAIDVLAGFRLDQNIEHIFDKLVRRKRGGWCYETNGLLGWALEKVGFQVQRVVAGVYRKDRGDSALGNHVVLLVHLGETYIADLGLGDALRVPIPLREGLHQQSELTFRLELLPDGYWRFHNHPMGSPSSFDFRNEPVDEKLLATKCTTLQADPQSYFVKNFECIRMSENSSVTLLGRVLRFTHKQGVNKEMITSCAHLEHVLEEQFGIVGVDISKVWPKILERHRLLFGHEDAKPL
jgi:N-hydroxyarylamine O-acetyltransferase